MERVVRSCRVLRVARFNDLEVDLELLSLPNMAGKDSPAWAFVKADAHSRRRHESQPRRRRVPSQRSRCRTPPSVELQLCLPFLLLLINPSPYPLPLGPHSSQHSLLRNRSPLLPPPAPRHPRSSGHLPRLNRPLQISLPQFHLPPPPPQRHSPLSILHQHFLHLGPANGPRSDSRSARKAHHQGMNPGRREAGRIGEFAGAYDRDVRTRGAGAPGWVWTSEDLLGEEGLVSELGGRFA